MRHAGEIAIDRHDREAAYRRGGSDKRIHVAYRAHGGSHLAAHQRVASQDGVGERQRMDVAEHLAEVRLTPLVIRSRRAEKELDDLAIEDNADEAHA
jgi:hypothetical protein